MLHLVFQSPLEIATLERIGTNEPVLFLENAVLYLLKKGSYHLQLSKMSATNRLLVLISDIETRGIATTELIEQVEVIDYSQWVVLTTQQQLVKSWF